MGDKRKLARHVTVAGVTYGPGDDVPADIAEQIRNPKAWLPLDDDTPGEDDSDAGKDAGTAAGDRLATAVTVGGRTYGPNDHIPDEVAAQIRNPKAWAAGRLPGAGKAKADDADGSAEKTPATTGGKADDGEQDQQPKSRTRR